MRARDLIEEGLIEYSEDHALLLSNGSMMFYLGWMFGDERA